MRDSRYIIKVNDVEYHSYKEMCSGLDIEFKEFMRLKHETPGILQGDLLSHFFDGILMRMTDSSFFINMKNKKNTYEKSEGKE